MKYLYVMWFASQDAKLGDYENITKLTTLTLTISKVLIHNKRIEALQIEALILKIGINWSINSALISCLFGKKYTS